jgi:hypothetical protein
LYFGSLCRPRKWDLEELQDLDNWEWSKTRGWIPVPSLKDSEYVGTSSEPSEGPGIYDHGMNDPDDDWWGT